MKKALYGVLLCALIALGVPSDSNSAAVSRIFGLAGECNQSYAGCTAIPLSLSIVCDGTLVAGNNCPQYWSPDWSDTTNLIAYGYTNQTTPGRCLKSVNGATTWSYCTADPFTTSYLNLTPAAFAAASDGSLLAAVNVNNTTQACVIKRSTNGGVSWSTVHTQNGTYACGAWAAAAIPSPMKCAKDANTCVLYGYDVATNQLAAVFTSSDNGATWTSPTGTVGNAIAQPIFGAALSDDGTVSSSGRVNAQSTTTFPYSRDGSTYVASVAWGTAVGATRCTGPFIYNTDPAVMCGANNSTQTWQMVRMNGNTPATIAQFTLGNGSPLYANSPDVIGIQWSSTVFYLITRLQATSATNVYVTKDSFSTVSFIGTLTPTTGYGANPHGDIYIWNGAIYWSSGYYTPTGHIMKIGF